MWVSGGYKGPWIDEAAARRFEQLPLLVVQDLFPSPLSERATYELPAAAFAERDGSYVNRSDRLQTVAWPSARRGACGPRAACSGRCSAARACIIPAPCWTSSAARSSISAAAAGPVPETGLDLKINMLAE